MRRAACNRCGDYEESGISYGRWHIASFVVVIRRFILPGRLERKLNSRTNMKINAPGRVRLTGQARRDLNRRFIEPDYTG
jgi:hypothetical protein